MMVLHGDNLENLVLSFVSMKGAWTTSEKSISRFHIKGKKKINLFISTTRREIQDI